MKQGLLNIAIFMSLIFGISAIPVAAVYAADSVDVFSGVCSNSDAAQSAVCKENKSSYVDPTDKSKGVKNPLFGPQGVLTFAINFMSILVGVAAVIMIIYAGIRYMTSGSNPSDVNKAREMILYALVGVAIAVSAQLLVRLFLYKIT